MNCCGRILLDIFSSINIGGLNRYICGIDFSLGKYLGNFVPIETR